MHSHKLLTYRVDVKISFADPCAAGRTADHVKTLEFKARKADADALALKMVEENRAALLSDVDGGKITAVYLWPLTLQCRLEDGKVDLRGWLYDRRPLWFADRGPIVSQRLTASAMENRTNAG